MRAVRIATLAVLVVIVCSAPSFARDGGTNGIGWQASSTLQGVSFKGAFSSQMAVQGVLGYTSLSIDEPSIEVDGHDEELDMTLGVTAWTVGGRLLFTLKEETNLDVYAGGGVNFYLISAETDILGDDVEISGSALGFQAVTGVEYRFQGLENLAFSTEIGFDLAMVNDLNVDTPGGDVTLSPNASIKSFFLGGGIHYYF